MGSYPAAPAALNLADMGGNVWDFCNDVHECDLGSDPAVDPVGPAEGDFRVVRGSSWWEYASIPRCAYREYANQVNSFRNIGFRIARTVPPSAKSDGETNRIRTRPTIDINQPNPFTACATIWFTVPAESHISLEIYSPAGRLVRSLLRSFRSAGSFSVTWDGTDDTGGLVSPGTYFCRLRQDGASVVRRMVMIK